MKKLYTFKDEYLDLSSYVKNIRARAAALRTQADAIFKSAETMEKLASQLEDDLTEVVGQ